MVRIQLTNNEERLRRFLLGVADFACRQNGCKRPQLRFAGGWVRDKVLGMNSPDIDIAVDNMTGLTFAKLMKKFAEEATEAREYDSEMLSRISEIPARPEQSKHLETATLRVAGLDIDIVNLRKEVYAEDSRNPQMEFGTPKEDAERRDATINALFYNLDRQEVEDFTGRGLHDMDLRIIRTPLAPFQTFKDDPLRVLRCIRFASRLSYSIAEDVEASMRDPVIQEALRSKITRERIGNEIEKMLKGPHPETALAYIDRLDLYGTIFTDLSQRSATVADTSAWSRVYNCLSGILQHGEPSASEVLTSTLIKNEDDRYLAWLICALTPWAPLVTSHPYTARKAQPKTFAALVARDSLKIDNKGRDVIDKAMSRLPEAMSLKRRVAETPPQTSLSKRKREHMSRDELGMLLYEWGASWRTSILAAMLAEIAQASGSDATQKVLGEYGGLVTFIRELGLLEAHQMKPAIDGRRLIEEVGRKPGPWMTEAVKALIRWQFGNPDAKDPAKGIEEVVSRYREGA